MEQFDLGIYFSLKVLEFFLIIAYIAANPSLFWTTAKLLVVSGIFQGLISIIQFETQSGMGLKLLGEYFPPANEAGASTLNTEPKLTRAYGTFPHPNVLGGFLSLVLAIFLYVSRETKSKIGFLIVSCGTIVLLWGIVVSFSRSAMLAAAVTLALFIIHLFVQKSYKKALYWTILTIVSCGTLALTYSEFIVPRTTETVSDNPAFSYRRQFNGMGLEIFRENPIFGVGPGQYTTAQESEYTLESWEHQPPHNIFIYLMATMGIFGLILAIFTYYKLGFTWNNQVHWLSIVLLAQVFILGNVDHYLVTIQQGILMFAIVLSFILINKIDVSQPRETSIK